MPRFTKRQKILSECLRLLLQLYNCGDLSKPDTKTQWTKIIPSLKRLSTILFRDSSDPNKLLSYDNTHLITFKNIMDQLKQSINTKELNHYDSIETSIKADLSYYINAKPIDILDSRTMTFKPSPSWKDIEQRVQRVTLKVDKKRYPASSVILEVRAISDFGALLLSAEPAEKPKNQIPCIEYLFWNSLIQATRSIIINYHQEFGSLDRIKICKYCGGLFFEKRKDAGFFCSRRCGKRHNREEEPSEKYLCRERQNFWLRNRVDKLPEPNTAQANTILKRDCGHCPQTCESGNCSILINRNLQVIKQIHEIELEEVARQHNSRVDKLIESGPLDVQ